MRRVDRALRSVESEHRQESYMGPLASTGNGGHSGNVNNLYNSQVRDAKMIMPYGISSRPPSGVKAQAVVNDNSDSSIVGVYDPNRPQVGVGEVCLYSAGGCSIYLSGNTITIRAANTNIIGGLSISGDVSIDGDISITGDMAVSGNADITGELKVNGQTMEVP